MNVPVYYANPEVDMRVQEGIVAVISSQPDMESFAHKQLTLMGAEPYFAGVAVELKEQASTLSPGYLAGAALGVTVLRSVGLGTHRTPLTLEGADFKEQRLQDTAHGGIVVLTDRLEKVVIPPYAYMQRKKGEEPEYGYACAATQALPVRLSEGVDMKAFVAGTTAILRVHEQARRRAAMTYMTQAGLVL